MTDCVFCRIVAGEIPAKIVYRDEDAIAFADLAPAAPSHLLVVPRRHIATLSALDDVGLGGRLLQAARRVAADAGYADEFRLVVNNGASAGQSVPHLHLHVLAGRALGWPPG